MTSDSARLRLPTLEVPSTDCTYLRYGSVRLVLKRVFDVMAASLLLMVSLPLFGLIAVLIKLDSSGPVFFAQARVGRRRLRFRMWKFRKMYDDLPEQGPALTRRRDQRLTVMGAFLERTKLDELPQLLNVLRGDMSIVGPRPELPRFVNGEPEWDQVLSVKPGLVGPNQLKHRNESELYPDDCDDIEVFYERHILPEKLAADAAYASNFGVLGDLLLFIRCAIAAIFGTVTWQTVVVRRWQIAHFSILAALGLLSMMAAHFLTGQVQAGVRYQGMMLAACLATPVCLILFRIPKALASSMTPDDFLRIGWCAATRCAVIVTVLLLADLRGLSRSVVLVDGTIFFAGLTVYKLFLYKVLMSFRVHESRALSRRLVFASFLTGPLSMAAVVSIRHGSAAWSPPQLTLNLSLILLASVLRPVFMLFKTIQVRENHVAWLLKEWRKLVMISLAGSAFMVTGMVLFNERNISRADVLADFGLYLAIMTVLSLRWNQREMVTTTARSQGANSHVSAERILVVGTGLELSAFVASLAVLPDRSYEIVGVVSPHREERTNMVGNHLVIGAIDDIPEILRSLRVSRVVVVKSALPPHCLADVERCCNGTGHLSYVELSSAAHPSRVNV